MSEVRPAVAGDLDWMLALNAAHERETSSLTRDELARMVAGAWRAVVIGKDAFLLTFDERAAYQSPNFQWFRARYPRFVYVDRIIVSADARGRGLARRLYEHAFAAARAEGFDVVACEVNVDPPNPGSDAFHASLGFGEIGQALLANGKRVRYLTRALA